MSTSPSSRPLPDINIHPLLLVLQVTYQDLARIIPTARTVYVPDNVFGGGERAVLEVR